MPFVQVSLVLYGTGHTIPLWAVELKATVKHVVVCLTVSPVFRLNHSSVCVGGGAKITSIFVLQVNTSVGQIAQS